MTRLVAAILALFCLSGGSTIRAQTKPSEALPDQRVSKAEAKADLDFLVRTLDSIHPNPYTVRSRKQFREDVERVRAALPDRGDDRDWCFQLSTLVASFEDGHMAVGCGFALSFRPPGQAQYADLFPLRLTLDNEQHLIVTEVRVSSGEVVRGDRLLRVNGRSADDVIAEMVREISGDTLAFRQALAVRGFSYQLARRVKGPPYTVTVLTADGKERDVLLPDVVPPEPGVRAATTDKKAQPPIFTYRTLASGVGYLDLFSLNTDEKRFKEDAKSLFEQIKGASVGTLVVDLRKNTGGQAEIAAILLSHLTEKPFRVSSRTEIKRSSELFDIREPLLAKGANPRIFDGRVGSFYIAGKPVKVQKTEPPFKGSVCFLTGPVTFSAAALLADAVKTYGLGTIIGTPTGGRPNTSGTPVDSQFPKSAASLLMPSMYVTRANGDTKDLNPVFPDISVETTASDIRTGRDPVLERAMNCGR